MNSQFADLATGDDAIAVRAHPDLVDRLGGEGTNVRVVSDHGDVVGPLRADHRLRVDTIAIGHGAPECDVSRLTSASIGIDPHTGMVEQSALPCRLLPID